MSNVLDGGGSSAPAPKAEPVKVQKADVVAAKTQAKEAGTFIGRRRGNLGRISSLLSAGYRGFGTEDQLG